MNTKKEKIINIMLIIEITIMSIFCLISIFEKIFISSSKYFFDFYFKFFSHLVFNYYFIFTIICILKLIIVFKIIINKRLKAKIYINNIFQLIISFLCILFFVFLTIFDFGLIWVVFFGIPLLIMAFSLLIFQIYFINIYKNKIIRRLYCIISPIVNLLLIFEMFRLNII